MSTISLRGWPSGSGRSYSQKLGLGWGTLIWWYGYEENRQAHRRKTSPLTITVARLLFFRKGASRQKKATQIAQSHNRCEPRLLRHQALQLLLPCRRTVPKTKRATKEMKESAPRLDELEKHQNILEQEAEVQGQKSDGHSTDTSANFNTIKTIIFRVRAPDTLQT